jgi:hypothetical protein
MVRTIIVAVAILLALAGVAAALSRPQVADPGPPVVLDSPAAAPAPGASHDADHDDATEDRDTRAGEDDADHDSDDQFEVSQPKPVKADGEDWDDDDPYDLDDDGDADDTHDTDD